MSYIKKIELFLVLLLVNYSTSAIQIINANDESNHEKHNQVPTKHKQELSVDKIENFDPFENMAQQMIRKRIFN